MTDNVTFCFYVDQFLPVDTIIIDSTGGKNGETPTYRVIDCIAAVSHSFLDTTPIKNDTVYLLEKIIWKVRVQEV